MKKRVRNILRCSVILLAIVAIGVFSWIADRKIKKENLQKYVKTANENYDEMITIYSDGKPYKPKKNINAVLVIGIDQSEIEDNNSFINSEQADFLILAVIDSEAETWQLIQINRDTMTEVTKLDIYGNYAGSDVMQIALAHTYGTGKLDSCRNTVDAVSNLFYGIDIDTYFSLRMDAIPIINDYFGGVEVHIDTDMTVADPAFQKDKTLTLTGEQAVHYVRARQSLQDSSNLYRMSRQQQYISGLVSKFKNTDTSISSNLLTKIQEYTVGNTKNIMIADELDVLKNYKFSGIVTLDGKSQKGNTYMEYYVDEEKLKQLVIDNFFEPVIAET